ncbi:hypothetical protein [Novosphingobium sp.]|uniref:hypothetical protein n=1 Tax=Novosphingobium sp. TaxID=1874826 RepID=UPI0035B43A62
MFSKFTRPASTLDKAIVASVTAMLAMNIFVLSQQLQAAPQVALSHSAASAQQA